MWVFTNRGYISVVQHREKPDLLLARARREGDLQAIFGYDIEVLETEKADYLFRTVVTRGQLATALTDEIYEIDYNNFKNSVENDLRRATYLRVWEILYWWQNI